MTLFNFLKSKFTAHNQHWLIYAQVVGSLLSLGQLLILTRVLDSEVFGQYRYGIALTMILPLFFLSGISNAITSITANNDEGVFFQAIKMYLRSTRIPSIISILIAFILLYFNFLFLGYLLLIIGIFSPLYQTVQLYNSYLNGKQDYKRVFLYGLIPDIGTVLSVITAAILFPTQPIIILGIFFLANILSTLVPFFFTIRSYKIKDTCDKSSENLMSLSRTVSQSNIIQGIGGQIDKVITFHLISSSGLAVYSIVTLVAQQFRGFQKILYAILLPKQSLNRDHTKFYKALWLYLIASALFCVVYIIAAPLIFSILFPEYIAFVYLSQLASLAIVFAPLTFFTLSTLHSRNNRKTIFEYTLATTLSSSILLFIGSILLGVDGVVFAFIISSIISGFMGIFFLRKFKTPQ